MESFEAELVKEQVVMFWDCLLHSFENGLSIVDFVATFTEAKDLTVEKIHQCLAFYIDVFDTIKMDTYQRWSLMRTTRVWVIKSWNTTGSRRSAPNRFSGVSSRSFLMPGRSFYW